MMRFLLLTVLLVSKMAFGVWGSASPVFSSKRSCQAVSIRNAIYCDGNQDCEAVIYSYIRDCRTADCKALIEGFDSYCSTDDCRAVIHRSTIMCGPITVVPSSLGNPMSARTPGKLLSNALSAF